MDIKTIEKGTNLWIKIGEQETLLKRIIGVDSKTLSVIGIISDDGVLTWIPIAYFPSFDIDTAIKLCKHDLEVLEESFGDL